MTFLLGLVLGYSIVSMCWADDVRTRCTYAFATFVAFGLIVWALANGY